jgi:hypothetical protein
MSMGGGKVTLQEYARYQQASADGDSAPLYVDLDLECFALLKTETRHTCPLRAKLRSCGGVPTTIARYIFDPDILTDCFSNGKPVQDDWRVPTCFGNDVMACLTGTQFRPLPPAWLLVGATYSGTPIHDHPMTVAGTNHLLRDWLLFTSVASRRLYWMGTIVREPREGWQLLLLYLLRRSP